MSSDQQKPWGGRFLKQTSDFVEQFTASVDFDSKLGEIDARCSIAHAKTIHQAGILSDLEFQAIENGLNSIIELIQNNEFQWKVELEDVHMNIESRLVEMIGEPGLKLHTARSRNDQVTATFKVYLLEQSKILQQKLTELQQAIVELASLHVETVMPGFTHMQSAQPVTFGHHLMAWYEMFDRDWSRVEDWQRRTNVSPMGVAALAGTSYPIDRQIFQKALGFDSITRNSLDTVSDRDYVLELLQHLSLIMTHLSRCCEEIVLWNSSAFDFIELPDELCTGSSIMPQKKNPDVAELIRGKCGRVLGATHALQVTLKGQPLAYNRDNQEDKEVVFDAVETSLACLEGMTLLTKGIRPNVNNMREMASRGHPTATDMADWLVRLGVPFRSAHEICGRAVRMADEQNKALHELSVAELKLLSEVFEESVYEFLTIEGSIASRSLPGGTAPVTVRKAIEGARLGLSERQA